MEQNLHDSPPWSRTIKISVSVVALLLVGLALFTFRSLIRQLVLAAVIAYVVNPVINFIDDRTRLKRTPIILLVYLLVFAGLIGGSFALGVALLNQISDLIVALPRAINNAVNWLAGLSGQRITIWAWELDVPLINWGAFEWRSFGQQLIGAIQPVLSGSTEILARIVTGTLGTVSTLLFMLFVSIYMTIELPSGGERVANVAQLPGYRRDAERLTRDFGRIWRAYLRGQIILGIVIGLIVWVSLLILGVPYAGLLGLLSGLLEFLPIIGPVIGTAAAALVALFVGSTWIALPAWQVALIVLVVMFLIQQLENSILVPRIVGGALDLHPLVVMVGVLMGGTVAGILGAVLAAPVMATINLVSGYAWRKMFDLPPFPKPEPESRPRHGRSPDERVTVIPTAPHPAESDAAPAVMIGDAAPAAGRRVDSDDAEQDAAAPADRDPRNTDKASADDLI